MAGLPLLKLAGLLVKQISKPISNRLKIEANNNELTHQRLVSLGQYLHQISSRFNVFVSGYRFLGAKPLPTEEALSKAITFISETVVFTFAGMIVIIEYQRSEYKNIEKNKKLLEKEINDKKLLNERFLFIEQRIFDIEKSLPPTSKIILEKRKESREKGIEPTDEYKIDMKSNKIIVTNNNSIIEKEYKDSNTINIFKYIWPFDK